MNPQILCSPQEKLTSLSRTRQCLEGWHRHLHQCWVPHDCLAISEGAQFHDCGACEAWLLCEMRSGGAVPPAHLRAGRGQAVGQA